MVLNLALLELHSDFVAMAQETLCTKLVRIYILDKQSISCRMTLKEICLLKLSSQCCHTNVCASKESQDNNRTLQEQTLSNALTWFKCTSAQFLLHLLGHLL